MENGKKSHDSTKNEAIKESKRPKVKNIQETKARDMGMIAYFED